MLSGQDLCNSLFCLVLPGDGWSARFEDSITAGCIPLVIQDGIYMPFEGWLNMTAIAVRISQANIHKLADIVSGIPPSRVTELLRNSALASK